MPRFSAVILCRRSETRTAWVSGRGKIASRARACRGSIKARSSKVRGPGRCQTPRQRPQLWGCRRALSPSLDGNSDGIFSAPKMQAASIAAPIKATVISLAIRESDRNGAMNDRADPHLPLARQGPSDAAISPCPLPSIGTKDGVVSAEEIAAARMPVGDQSRARPSKCARMAGPKNGVFRKSITGQTASGHGQPKPDQRRASQGAGSTSETVSLPSWSERRCCRQ